MAEFTYQTRRKLSETWVADMKEKGKPLSEQEKTMLPDLYYYSMPQDTCKSMRQLLQNGTYKTLSELYKILLAVPSLRRHPQGFETDFYIVRS